MTYGPGKKAFITGVSGLTLSDEEKAFLEAEQPWGLILFKRNCDNPEQVKSLVAHFRAIAGYEAAPVFIDQEGGRVQRLRPPHWTNYPPARALVDAEQPERAVYIVNRLIANDLAQLGINADCAPLLDVAFPQTHDVIGDRAYSSDPGEVARFARAAIDGLLDGGVLPVIKHIPGHGRATSDSHLELPRVSASIDELRAIDFAPFKALSNAPLAMTAHILYDAIDEAQPITLSKVGIEVFIRDEIGFDGLLMSDDISMKALKGPIGRDSARAIEAGCDLVLHCNGDIAEMREVAANVPQMEGEALLRSERSLAMLKLPSLMDVEETRQELLQLTSSLSLS